MTRWFAAARGQSGCARLRDELVADWAHILHASGYSPLDRRERLALVRGLTGQLIEAALHDPVDLEAAEQVGATIVTAGFTMPTALGATLALLHRSFPAVLAAESSRPTGFPPALPDHCVTGGGFLRPGRPADAGSSVSPGPLADTGSSVSVGLPADAGWSVRPGALADAGRPPVAAAAPVALRSRPRNRLRWTGTVTRRLHRSSQGNGAGWPTVAQALTDGYVTAMRDHTLTAQETLLRAAYDARSEVMRALQSSQDRLNHAALHDPLTGLPNRAMLEQRLRNLVATAGPDGRLGLCLIDIDRFTAVNASAGHPAGDRLLVAVANRLRRLATGPESVLARVGADQFAIIICPTTGPEDVTRLADQALHLLSNPFRGQRNDVSVTACAGVVELALRDTDPVDLIRAADITLLWAKSEGPGTWALFDAERKRRDVAGYRLVAQLPDALRQNQFILHYQPIVDLSTGVPVGVEALARWRHPTLGLVQPDDFIGPAEDTGLILPLGRGLLAQACRQAARWQRARTPPFVSVNLSVRQLRDPQLVQHVADTLQACGLAPEQLHLEITESLALANDHNSGGTLAALSELGVHLALDDFGSGYANLAYLRDLAIDSVKLDAAFVQGGPGHVANGEPTDLTLLAALISLAHSMDLSVTAEGIETAEQADRLRRIGCDMGQGWHLGRPVSPADLRL